MAVNTRHSRASGNPGVAGAVPLAWVPACGNVIQFKAGGLTASGPKTTVRISPLMRSVGELATSKRAQRGQKCHFPNARMALANWITAPKAGTQARNTGRAGLGPRFREDDKI